MSDFKNIDNDVTTYNLEPYILIDGLTGSTRYIGISISTGDVNGRVWKIKKEWVVGNVRYMGFPDGNQAYEFVWNDRASYTYK